MKRYIVFLIIFRITVIEKSFSQTIVYPVPVNFIHQLPIEQILNDSGYFTASKPLMAVYDKNTHLPMYSYRFKESDTNRTRWLNKFTKEDLLKLDSSGYYLSLNPMMDFTAGIDNKFNTYYYNTRGIQIKGYVNKVSLYAIYTENQAGLPLYQQNYVKNGEIVLINNDSSYSRQTGYGMVQGKGRSKPFKNKDRDFGYFQGQWVYSISSELRVGMGYDKLFFGQGYRSILWSDFASPFPYAFLQYNKRKKWQYEFYAGQLLEGVRNKSLFTTAETYFFKKTFYIYHFQWHVGKNLTLSYFEKNFWMPGYFGSNNWMPEDYIPAPFYQIFRKNAFQRNIYISSGAGLSYYLPSMKTIIFGQGLHSFQYAGNYAWQAGIKKFGNIWSIWAEYNHAYQSYYHEHHLNENIVHPFGPIFKEVVLGTLVNYRRWMCSIEYISGEFPYTNRLYLYELPGYSTNQNLRKVMSWRGRSAFIVNPAYQWHLFIEILSRKAGNTKENYLMFGINTNLVVKNHLY